MSSLLGSAVSAAAVVSLTGVDPEAVFVYGLVAFVIGLIAWSKYNEPPLSDPYSALKTGYGPPATAGQTVLGTLVAIPALVQMTPDRERR